MSHAQKHSPLNQQVQEALKSELLRALNVFDSANDMRGAIYDFGVDVEVTGDRASAYFYPAQIEGTFTPADERLGEDQRQSVHGAAGDFMEKVMFTINHDENETFKITDAVAGLNAFFTKEKQPIITSPVLTRSLEKH